MGQRPRNRRVDKFDPYAKCTKVSNMRVSLVISLAVGALVSMSVNAIGQGRVHIITTGWNAPTVQQFDRDGEDFRRGPVDGSGVIVRATGSTATPLARAHGPGVWPDDWFTETEAVLDRIDPDLAGGSYLVLNANPGNADLLDDAAWKDVVDHWRIAARLARRGHFRGLIFDPEPYTQPFGQFNYAKQRLAPENPFAAYADAARRRGRDVMTAVQAEFPGIEILSYFWMSYLIDDHRWLGPTPLNAGGNRRPDFDSCLDGHEYGLLPAFFSGLLDVADSNVTFIDGCEHAYWFETDAAFADHADRVRNRGRMVVEESVREKYDRQVKVGMPIYMDIMHPTAIEKWTLHPARLDRTAVLADQLRRAIAASDGWVWVYGESGSWWPDPGKTAAWPGKDVYPNWEKRLPGVAKVFSEARRIRPNSLVARGDAPPLDSGETVGPPKKGLGPPVQLSEWKSWRSEGTGGQVTFAGESATIRASRNRSVLRSFPVKPGDHFRVTAELRQRGRGRVGLTVRHRDAEGRWITLAGSKPGRRLDTAIYPPPANDDGWSELIADSVAPERAATAVIIGAAELQLTDDDEVEFRDFEARPYR